MILISCFLNSRPTLIWDCALQTGWPDLAGMRVPLPRNNLKLLPLIRVSNSHKVIQNPSFTNYKEA